MHEFQNEPNREDLDKMNAARRTISLLAALLILVCALALGITNRNIEKTENAQRNSQTSAEK